MASIICKDKNEIFYVQFGDRYDSSSRISKYNFAKILSKRDGRHLDMRILDLRYYDGWTNNQHHITTSTFQHNILPFFSYVLKTFKFNPDDFERVPFFDKDYKYDCSYLKPKKEMLFTLEINGVKIGEHLPFDDIMNIKIHDDAEAFEGYKGNEIPTYSEYHRLYRGAHACSRVINETIDNDCRILISGDSMMIPAITTFCCYYKEVVYMDNRDKKSHKEYFDGKYFDEILLCFYEPNAVNKVLEINLQ